MNKNMIKLQLRKVRWATERETGKKLGKKGLIEVQKVVMAMQPKEEQKEAVEHSNWKERPKEKEAGRISFDLNSLIGKKF
jgi:hypothetical protein